MTNTNFAALGLATPILDALVTENHEIPTPIQAQAIPEVMAGRDLLGLAQTGTGKTAAFTLPILHRLVDLPRKLTPKTAHVLILAPTRELAVQIGERTQAYGRNLGLKQAIILGGVSQHKQVRDMSRGVDILIATPGRLLDLVNQRHLRLDMTSILVLDEADRMFDMGFIVKVRQIVALMGQKRQTLLFSATMPPDIAKLAQEILTDPVRIEVTPKQVTADRIDQSLYYVDTSDKKVLLAELLNKDPSMERVIIFTRTKHAADRLSTFLDKAGVRTDALHGDKTQNARQRSLENFRTGSVRALVATDIAARGIDVNNVTHVVNYDLPNEAESYVHRIGRTARAGSEGKAISFCDGSERHLLREIEKLTKIRLNVVGGDLESLTPMPPVGSKGGRRFQQGGGQNSDQKRGPRQGQRLGQSQSDRRPDQRADQRGDYRTEGRFENRDDNRSDSRPENRQENRSENRAPRRFDKRPDHRFEQRSEHRPEGHSAAGRRSESSERPSHHRGERTGDRPRFEGRQETRSEGRQENRHEGRGAFRGESRGEARGETRNENRGERRPPRRDAHAAPRRDSRNESGRPNTSRPAGKPATGGKKFRANPSRAA